LLQQPDTFIRLAQLGRVGLSHARLDTVYNVGDLQPPLQARLRDAEVFRDPADRGFAPASDRDDIATKLQWECVGHGDHPSLRTEILTAQKST
jgi:hypothetical protein